jgi:hypothetical protein
MVGRPGLVVTWVKLVVGETGLSCYMGYANGNGRPIVRIKGSTPAFP